MPAHCILKVQVCTLNQQTSLAEPWLAPLQHDDAMRSAQRRISDLLQKADAVDKVEHERVTAALRAAQEQLASAQAELARLQPLEALNTQLTQKADASQSRIASLEVCP